MLCKQDMLFAIAVTAEMMKLAASFDDNESSHRGREQLSGSPVDEEGPAVIGQYWRLRYDEREDEPLEAVESSPPRR